MNERANTEIAEKISGTEKRGVNSNFLFYFGWEKLNARKKKVNVVDCKSGSVAFKHKNGTPFLPPCRMALIFTGSDLIPYFMI